MKSKTNIEILIFLTVCICIALAILGFAVQRVDTKPYYPEGRVGKVNDPCGLTDVVCDNEPKVIYAEVTKYTAIETCPQHCINATGSNPIVGRSIACPRRIKKGTKVQIEGILFTCDDFTAIRYDGRFDIFAGYTERDYREALAWGVKVLPVTILE
jgi:3D (Asp-Asp-Asp) domain-containing protein